MMFKKSVFLIGLMCLNTAIFACESTLWNDILHCYMQNQQAHQQRLDTEYQNTLKRIKKNQRSKFMNAQQQWQKQIRQQCEQFNHQQLYGREGAFDVIQCEIDEIEKRINWLKRYAY